MVNATHLWTRGGLVVTRAALDAVECQAVAAYDRDEEACGYLVGPAAAALVCDEAVALPNLASALHARDPETYFRTARTFFAFDAKRFDDAVRAGAVAERPVKVIYHSHLDADAHLSPTDAAVMSLGEPPAFEGGPVVIGPGPAWPLSFLVTSVRARVVREHRLFIWDGEARRFLSSTLDVS